MPKSTKFIKCDTTSWDVQVNLFREAAKFSADSKISYVIANAGVAHSDVVFSYAGKRTSIYNQL